MKQGSCRTWKPRNVIDNIQGRGACDRLVTEAASVDVTTGDRTLIGLLLGPAYTGAGRDCWSARRARARDCGRRTVGVVGTAGGNGGRSSGRTRRATVSKADNTGTGGNISAEVIGVDVWPLGSIVHSRKGGELVGGRLVCSSVLHVDLNAAWIILGRSDRMKCNDLIANQILTRDESSGDSRGPYALLGDQLVRSPLSIVVSALIDLKPFTIRSIEVGTISVA